MRLVALLLAILLAGCERPLPPGTTELIYATPYSPGHPFSRADQRWIEFVEARSGGTLRIRPIWSGGLLSSDMSMEELRHGVADIGLITPIYARGGSHFLRIQTGFYSGADSIDAQLQLYRCIDAAEPQVARELHGLKLLAVQGGALPGIVTRDRPVRTLDDLQGLRIRAPTELLSVLDRLGVDAVNMPMGDVYSALAKGVIDGVIAPPDTFSALHFAEVADYYATLAIPRGAYPSRAMGLDRWNLLTEAERAILTESIPVWENALTEEVQAATERGLAEARRQNIRTTTFSDAEQHRFDRLYLEDAEQNARALRDVGIDATHAFRTARASVRGRNQISCRSPT
ncbi:TRAP transporter substrate-binding protein DctP [Sphingosinithalassobacter sp. CS137]|uniref:TRAP transporter substrate-binding protein DctP n=1 Tax=Sphingosinithalassobacter sp. CS137 TaxID=2762748 RepID=UPI00165EA90B|nr:TRAP transporter substrate-binding protein DctP [Sphingosinithalassobacter sp. CS137]